jgi:hypothetical protein
MARKMKRLQHGPDVTVLENKLPTLASSPDGNIDHRSGQVVGPNHLNWGRAAETRDKLRETIGN